jgi:hypothetical protein
MKSDRMRLAGSLLIIGLGCTPGPNGFAGVDFDSVTGGETQLYMSASRPPDLGLSWPVPQERLDLPSTGACTSLDVLIVVDNSGSMLDDQVQLQESITFFTEKLIDLSARLEGEIHIGVVTTDGYKHNPPGCNHLGSLVTQTYRRECIPEGGRRFLTAEDDLETILPCLMDVGTTGSGVERQVGAVIEATLDWHNLEGRCNAGFHRRGNGDLEPSGLVILIVTDEDDVATTGEPDEWWLRLLFQHGSDNIAAIGLLNPNQPCPTGVCRLRQFIRMLPNYYIGDLNVHDYHPFFDRAVAEVSGVCRLDVPVEP